MITRERNLGSTETYQRSGRRSTLGELIHDLITLGELQFKLLSRDLQDLKKGINIPLAAMFVGAVLALSSLPVLLLAFGWLITSLSDWPIWAGMLISGIVLGLIPALLCIWWGYRSLFTKANVMNRSANEFGKNVRWLKRRLKSAF